MSSDPALLWALGHSTTIASNTQSQGASASAAPGAGGYPPLQPGHAAIAPQPQAYSAPAPQPDYSAPPQADYAARQQQTIPPGYLPPSYMPSASSAPLATATVGGAPVLPGYGGNVSVEVSGHQLMPPKPKQPKQAKPSKRDMPKPPKSGYLCFAQERRDQLLKIAEERGEMDDVVKLHGDLSRAIGRQWKALSPEDKRKWTAVSEADQQRYVDECKAAGVEPKLFPHIAGQVRIARPDRILEGKHENLVDPALMGVQTSQRSTTLKPPDPKPTQVPASAISVLNDGGAPSGGPVSVEAVEVHASVEADARVVPRARGTKRGAGDGPDDASPPLRWNARTRSFV